MRLCFDATRFGFGLKEAIELAAVKGLPGVGFTFLPFTQASRKSGPLAGKEREYLESIKAVAAGHQILIACLMLDYCLDVEKDKAVSHFQAMITKLAAVASTVGAPKICFSLEPGTGDGWKTALEAAVQPAVDMCAASGVKLLLRTGTPPGYHGVSLSRWTPTHPQLWREILACCPGLALSFSPADCLWQGIDYLRILPDLLPAIEHIEANDVEVNRRLMSDAGMFGPLWWRYRLPGKGQLDWAQLMEALKLYNYSGFVSVHIDDEFVAGEMPDLEEALDYSIGALRFLVEENV